MDRVYMVMACMVVAYLVTAYPAMADQVMAYAVMVYVVMASAVMAFTRADAWKVPCRDKELSFLRLQRRQSQLLMRQPLPVCYTRDTVTLKCAVKGGVAVLRSINKLGKCH